MNVDAVCKFDLAPARQVGTYVVVGQFLYLVAEVGHPVDVLLYLHQITGMQVAVVVEVKNLEHEIGLHNGRGLEQWYVELLHEVIHVDSAVFVPLC